MHSFHNSFSTSFVQKRKNVFHFGIDQKSIFHCDPYFYATLIKRKLFPNFLYTYISYIFFRNFLYFHLVCLGFAKEAQFIRLHFSGLKFLVRVFGI